MITFQLWANLQDFTVEVSGALGKLATCLEGALELCKPFTKPLEGLFCLRVVQLAWFQVMRSIMKVPECKPTFLKNIKYIFKEGYFLTL